MNKKIITSIISLLLIVPNVAHAKNNKLNNLNSDYTVAVLDTAIDSSISQLSGKIIYEVCVLEWNSCPNGTSFQEGDGAAKLPTNIITNNGFDHGTNMVGALLNSNPNVKIVFVRIIGNTPTGGRQIANEKTVVQALDWVIANKDKFNISAVTMSQGHHNLPPLADYCPNTPNTKQRIQSLLNLQVPTFMAVGNNYDYQRIDWPSCIDEVIAIGALNRYNSINLYSNRDSKRLDFFELGDMNSFGPTGAVKRLAGTSAAAQYAAGQWILAKQKKPELSYQQLMDLIKSTAQPVSGTKGAAGIKINIAGIL